MSHFIDAINTVLKYGAAPPDLLLSGIKSAHEEDRYYDNHQDAKIQDVLQEHDDPREAIVRGHLNDPDSISAQITRHIGPHTSLPNPERRGIHTPTGWVTFEAYTHPTNGKSAHVVSWRHYKPTREYSTVMTPDQANQIHDRLLEHFPDQPEPS